MRRLRVKEVAQAKGVTMSKLQRAADINLKTIQAIWHNPRHNASLNTLDKIAEVLDVPITELIEDVPAESPEAEIVKTGQGLKKKPLQNVAENTNKYPSRRKD
ncbi:MAG TPA: helix-turn-helix transcriptional regulator [Ktedonobacteraceae bacterium]|nr:helix-turn-helix transcriptional regulator [Ktedonobacteraceae bacterium]